MAVKPFDTERSCQRRVMLLKVHFHPNASIHFDKCCFFFKCVVLYSGVLSRTPEKLVSVFVCEVWDCCAAQVELIHACE